MSFQFLKHIALEPTTDLPTSLGQSSFKTRENRDWNSDKLTILWNDLERNGQINVSTTLIGIEHDRLKNYLFTAPF